MTKLAGAKLAGIVIGFIGFSLCLGATPARAIHPPPARILDLKTAPQCVAVLPAFWINRTLSKYSGENFPAIAVRNNCAKAVILESVTMANAPEATPAAPAQLNVALHSEEDGYHAVYLDAAGGDCAQPLAALRDANKTQCSSVMISPGDTLTMPMEWGSGFALTGSEGFKVSGVLVNTRNPDEALPWLKKSAEGGDATSQRELGDIYAEPGAHQDIIIAFSWWQKAAAQDEPLAQFKTARALDTGEGATQDLPAAAKLYEKVAALGPDNKNELGLAVLQSRCRLGAMYADGIGVKQDDEKMAVLWNSDARMILKLKPKALKGDADAALALGNVLRPNMDCRKEANTEAAKWYRIAADKGVTDAEYYIGRLYDAGEGLARSDKEAMKWYARAAAKGHAQALYQFGMLYARPHDGQPADKAVSLKLIRIAADQGHTLAMYRLARLYAAGSKETPQDHAEAFYWYSLPMKYEDRLETRPGMNDIGVWRLSVIDPYATQREEEGNQLDEQQMQAVRKRIFSWKPVTPAQSAAQYKEIAP